MASAKNIVLAGDYTGCRVFRMPGMPPYISGTMKKMDDILLIPDTIADYVVLTEAVLNSGNNGVLTNSLDPACLVGVKLRASESMQAKGIYTIAFKFKNDKRSLIEVDEKIYNAFCRIMQKA